MGHYKSNLRDLEFNLFEFLKIQKVLEAGKFGDLDEETARGILSEVKALAEARPPKVSPTPTATPRSSIPRPTP